MVPFPHQQVEPDEDPAQDLSDDERQGVVRCHEGAADVVEECEDVALSVWAFDLPCLHLRHQIIAVGGHSERELYAQSKVVYDSLTFHS